VRFPVLCEFMAKHNELGKKGEQLAVDFLIKNGYEIVARN